MTLEKDTDATHWMKVVAIVQVAFRDGTLAGKSTLQTVVLISKRDGRDFRGIGLIEVPCMTATGLLNHRLTSVIQFHGILYSFWSGCGTGTGSLKENLLQQLKAMREAVLYKYLCNSRRCTTTWTETGVSKFSWHTG